MVTFGAELCQWKKCTKMQELHLCFRQYNNIYPEILFQPRCKYALISLQAITAHGKTFFKILLFYFTLSISFAPNFQINYYFFQFMTTYWLTGDYYLNNVLTDIANLVLCIFLRLDWHTFITTTVVEMHWLDLKFYHFMNLSAIHWV